VKPLCSQYGSLSAANGGLQASMEV